MEEGRQWKKRSVSVIKQRETGWGIWRREKERTENKRKIMDGEKGEKRREKEGGRELNREMQTQRNRVQYMRLIFESETHYILTREKSA